MPIDHFREDKDIERTFLMIKPDGVERGLVGEIISRFENKGFTLIRSELFRPSRETLEAHYAVHLGKPFYEGLLTCMLSGPVIAMVWEGNDVIALSRKLIGATNYLAAEPGTIRGDHVDSAPDNLIHGSDSPENAELEIGIWFPELVAA